MGKIQLGEGVWVTDTAAQGGYWKRGGAADAACSPFHAYQLALAPIVTERRRPRRPDASAVPS
jgi:hypothetical protein